MPPRNVASLVPSMVIPPLAFWRTSGELRVIWNTSGAASPLRAKFFASAGILKSMVAGPETALACWTAHGSVPREDELLPVEVTITTPGVNCTLAETEAGIPAGSTAVTCTGTEPERVVALICAVQVPLGWIVAGKSVPFTVTVTES